MQIDKIHSQSFGAIIRIKRPEDLVLQLNKSMENMPDYAKSSSGSSLLGTSSGITTGVPISNTVATCSDIAGSAFSAKAAGVDSFGIVPSVIAKITPYATPQTVASSIEHPVTAGGIFSTIGGFIRKHAKIKFNVEKKVPS